MGATRDNYDFCGWATKNNLKCADGRVIRHNAFKGNDGKTVPLVWNHQHNSPQDVLGHALLENRDEGVYAYCLFNKSSAGQDAKEAVMHGDITSMSIWANNLEQIGPDVAHGVIREVSLVHSGANPGAFIESVLEHGMPMGEDDDEGILHTGDGIILAHAEDSVEVKKEDESVAEESKKSVEKTVGDVFDTLTEEQKKAVAIVIGQAIEDARGGGEDEEDDEDMKHNIFDQDGYDQGTVLSHADMQQIMSDAKRLGSLREAVNEHIDNGVLSHAAIDTTGMTTATGSQTYGFNDPSMLFPDYKSLNNPPEWISRNMTWVSKVMGGVHHTPFSRIKSLYANITEDEARAKGYIKGKQKKDEVFSTLKRTTDPQTVYKRQKMDRDDIIDITDFDVIAWIKAEMRVMLDEEIARAILIGDGRPSDSEDKIQELHIRPVVKDVPLFNTVVRVSVPANADEQTIAKATINAIIRARKHYKGSGSPTFWTTEDVQTEMLLLEDGIGHKLYKSEAELATALRVSSLVPVEPMDGHKVTIGETEYPLIGVIVNLNDYNVGADKGGEINMFDDFDIDCNQQKYLIETRISGALVKPFSALTIVLDKAGAAG